MLFLGSANTKECNNFLYQTSHNGNSWLMEAESYNFMKTYEVKQFKVSYNIILLILDNSFIIYRGFQVSLDFMQTISAPEYLINEYLNDGTLTKVALHPYVNSYNAKNCTKVPLEWTIMGKTLKANPLYIVNENKREGGPCVIVVSTVWSNPLGIEWILGSPVVENVCLSLNYETDKIGIGMKIKEDKPL